MNKEILNTTKQQLWNHYQALIKRGKELGWLFDVGEDYIYDRNRRGNFLVDQMVFCRSEIKYWSELELNL